jgi:hypothetical protein
MHRKIIIFTCLAFYCSFQILSQKVLQTELGNSVIVEQNGNVIFSENYNNPFENPSFNFIINDEDKIKLGEINKYFQELDLNFFKTRIFLDKELLLNQTMLSAANVSKNKVEVKKWNSELSELDKLNKTNEKKYLNLKKEFDKFNRVYTLKDRKKIISIIDNQFEKNIKTIDSPNEETTNKGVEKNIQHLSNSQLIKVDDRKPWDIHNTYEDNLLIIHTPSTLKSYYRDGHLLKGYSNIIKRGNNYFLTLDLIFASNDVMKSYGFIKEGDFLKINFIHGQSMFLLAHETVIGKIENSTGNTIYKGEFKFKSKADTKRIGKSFIDSIGILWSSGFEYYPVYKIDLLSKQFQMLN